MMEFEYYFAQREALETIVTSMMWRGFRTNTI